MLTIPIHVHFPSQGGMNLGRCEASIKKPKHGNEKRCHHDACMTRHHDGRWYAVCVVHARKKVFVAA